MICVAAGLAAGVTVASGERAASLVLLSAAGGIVAFSLHSHILFLTWLSLAPFLQNSAETSPLGRLLVFACYMAPPIVLLMRTLAAKGAARQLFLIDVLPALYILYVLSSLVFTTDYLRVAPASSVKTVYTTVAIGILAYYLLAFGENRTLGTVRVVRAFLRIGIVLSLMGIIDGLVGWNLWNDTGWHGEIRRAVATLANPAVFGAFIGMCLALALGILVWRGPVTLRAEAYGMIALGCPALFLSYTRAPILATVAVCSIIAFSQRKTRLLAAAAVVVAVVAVTASWSRIESTPVYRERISNTENVQARALIRRWSLELAAERPFTGWGYNSFDRVKNSSELESGSIPRAFGTQNTSHDTWLTVLVEYGVTGLLLLVIPWLAIVYRGLKDAMARNDMRWFLAGATGAIAVYVVTASTIDMRFFSFVPAVPWIILGLMRRAQGVGREPSILS
jgi:O-antigen ligase